MYVHEYTNTIAMNADHSIICVIIFSNNAKYAKIYYKMCSYINMAQVKSMFWKIISNKNVFFLLKFIYTWCAHMRSSLTHVHHGPI